MWDSETALNANFYEYSLDSIRNSNLQKKWINDISVGVFITLLIFDKV